MKKNLFLALAIAAAVSFSGFAQTTPSGNKKEDKKTEKRDSTYRKRGTGTMPSSPSTPRDTMRRDTTGKK